MDEEEKMLVGQIQEIKKEKDFLTSNLPSLRRTNSDDDLLSTDDGSLDDVDASKFLFHYELKSTNNYVIYLSIKTVSFSVHSVINMTYDP